MQVLNIFDFMQIEERPAGKVTQLVKHFDEIPLSKKHWPMIAQEKKDGIHAILVVPDEGCLIRGAQIFGRTGKKLTNVENLEELADEFDPGVYMGELCLPGESLEVLSGIVNPNRTKGLPHDLQYWEMEAQFWFFDRLTLAEFQEGFSDTPWLQRLRRLDDDMRVIPTKMVWTEKQARVLAKEITRAGGEGIVLRHSGDAGWVAGHKGFRAMKIVRHIEYDLLCVDTEEGTGKYQCKVANLVFRWKDGKTIKAMLGKGWSHEDAEQMWFAIQEGRDEGSPVGRIYQVYGLQDSSKGKIRLPKVGELRHDKDEPDY